MLKNKLCVLFLNLLLAINIFSYEIFFSGEELVRFLKEKILESNSLRLVSFSLDDTISNELLKVKSEIFLEYEGGYSGVLFLPIIYDKNIEGYLHEKFIVFDDNSVLFGTGNFTKSGLLTDFNVFIYTDDQKIVNVFLQEISNFKKGKYANDKSKIKVNLKKTDLNNVKIVTGPSDQITKEILNNIKKAKKSIKVFSYSFTDPYFVEALERMSSKGVDVQILSDDWNKLYDSPIKYLSNINVRYNDKIHAKTIIIDEKKSIIGSYNLTYRAREKNDEIIMIIDNESVANILTKKFDLLFQ